MSAWTKTVNSGRLFESQASALARAAAEAGIEGFALVDAERDGDDVDLIFTASGENFLSELVAQQDRIRIQFGFGFFAGCRQHGRRFVLSFSDDHSKTRHVAYKRAMQQADAEERRRADAENRLNRQRDRERSALAEQVADLQRRCARLTQERDALRADYAALAAAERERHRAETAALAQQFADELAKYPHEEVHLRGGAHDWDHRIIHHELPADQCVTLAEIGPR